MCQVITVGLQKGGVGKTVSALNLAVHLAARDKRVCVIDFDPQCNLSMIAGAAQDDSGLFELILNALDGETPDDLTPYLYEFENIALLAGSRDLANIEQTMAAAEKPRAFHALRHLVERLRPRFDFILIDTPPFLGNLSINALSAADSVIIPCPPTDFAIQGLDQLLDTVRDIRLRYNPQLICEGIFFTMVKRWQTPQMLMEALREQVGESLTIFRTEIPYRADIDNAIRQGKSLMRYKSWSDTARSYGSLAGELLDRLEVNTDGQTDACGGEAVAAYA